MANVFIEEGTLTAIGNAIRAKTGKEDKILPADMPAEIEGISSESGGDNYYDAFWDTFQNNGNGTNYYYAFAYGKWKDSNYNPKYPIKTTTGSGLSNTFYLTGITNTKVEINTSSATSLAGCFYWARTLETIPLLRIRSAVTAAKSAFSQCYALKNITIEGTIACDWEIGDSPLNRASIESIMRALSPNVSGKTVVFNEAAINAAFETSPGANDGKMSMEWAALVDSHQEKDEEGNVISGWNFGYKAS